MEQIDVKCGFRECRSANDMFSCLEYGGPVSRSTEPGSQSSSAAAGVRHLAISG